MVKETRAMYEICSSSLILTLLEQDQLALLPVLLTLNIFRTIFSLLMY